MVNKMKLKKYNQLFEADIKQSKGIPSDYIEDIERKGREQFGYDGPNPQEFRQMMGALNNIMRLQQGKQEELTEIGKEIIMNHYGSILDDVELDIKIVNPDDPEKREMVDKMKDKEDSKEDSVDIPSNDVNIEDDAEIEVAEIDKRKILNNLMQGEAQNVHSMMHESKDKIDEIDPQLFDLYSTLLEINRKFDWKDDAQIMENPDFANVNEVNWGDGEEGEEEGQEEPQLGIKVRALDLPMVIHETVKAIYELIMANAIPDNEYLANRIMSETDTLSDEKQDIKFGPFIAADIRDYIIGFLERNKVNPIEVTNIREFIYSKMVEIPADIFVELIYSMLDGNIEKADKMLNQNNILEQALADATGDVEDFDPTSIGSGAEGESEQEAEGESEFASGEQEADDMLKPKEKSYADMSKGELDKILNQALDVDDFETIKKLQPFL